MRSMSWQPVAAAAAVTALCVAPVAQGAERGRAAQAEKTPTARGWGGAAASVEHLASEAAIYTLRRGGNAADAAVAAAAVLGVTEPFSSGIGGGGFMVIRRPNGKVTTIDGRETAPAAMNEESFMENGEALDFDDARYSGMSAGVPGTVATWAKALRRFGTISMRRALRDGIRVARRGFVVDQTFHDQIEGNVEYFDDLPATAEIYLDEDGTPRDVGSRLRNPDMARAYQRIARRGAMGFYEGSIADAMVEASQNPPTGPGADHTWRPGMMTADDLKSYRAPRRKPTRVSYRGLDVWGMGPPSSGGSTVGEALNILEGYQPLGGDRTEALHRFLEASRYAFADRNAFLADADYFDVPLRGLLSDDFAAERRALITGQAANREVEAGDPYDEQAGSAAAGAGDKGTSTTHLTVADEDGMVVSYTFTIESTGGNGIVVPGWGFLLNNELTDFNYDSTTHPNRVQGGKRPRSSMAPTIVTRDGDFYFAVGSPGGSTIITTVLQLLIERIDLGHSLPLAVAVPRATQRNGSTTRAEPAFMTTEAPGLTAAHGHAFGDTMEEIGAATGIERRRSGRFVAAAEDERRGGGSAMVVSPRRR
jgi:gamma-glutamyltranspeptidase / glutathione hydrolase